MFLAVVLLYASLGWATTYYIDDITGHDTALGKSPETALQSHQGSFASLPFWNGRDGYGNKLATGLYLLKIQTPTEHQYQRLLLLE